MQLSSGAGAGASIGARQNGHLSSPSRTCRPQRGQTSMIIVSGALDASKCPGIDFGSNGGGWPWDPSPRSGFSSPSPDFSNTPAIAGTVIPAEGEPRFFERSPLSLRPGPPVFIVGRPRQRRHCEAPGDLIVTDLIDDEPVPSSPAMNRYPVPRFIRRGAARPGPAPAGHLGWSTAPVKKRRPPSFRSMDVRPARRFDRRDHASRSLSRVRTPAMWHPERVSGAAMAPSILVESPCLGSSATFSPAGVTRRWNAGYEISIIPPHSL